MNCAPTLTADEFRTIHNAVCNLDGLVNRLEEILKPELFQRLVQARNEIRNGLAGAYDQDHQAFARKSRQYDSVKSELGLTHSEWSMYEVDDLGERHPFEGATKVVHKNHWGDKPVTCSVNGLSWAALWVAADACIRDSGDQHHVFIEGFRPDKNDPSVLIMSTGS